MSYVGSKTPVSIVNEYFIAIGITPSYELIVNQTGTHAPIFVYRVSAGDYFADGKGTSKQQAKHNAAQLLIDVLKGKPEGPASQLEHAIQTLSCPQDNQIGFNAVGQLTDYCTTKNYPQANYVLIQDEGPAHARIFTYRCSVSNLSELGTSRTKKQAKHQAAYSMLVKLKSLCGEEVNAVVKINVDKTPSPKRDFPEKDEEISKKFAQLTKSKRSATNSSFIADQYRSYSALRDKSTCLAKIETDELLPDNSLVALRTIADELELQLEERVFHGKVTFVKLPLSPILVRGAPTLEEAARNALKAILALM